MAQTDKDYLDQTYTGGSEAYATSQGQRYKDAVAAGDSDLISRLYNDSQKVGYSLPTSWNTTQNASGYNPQYATQNQNILQQLQTKMGQSVDYTKDPSYTAMMALAQQNAAKAGQQTMEATNQRGILNSTITGDRVAQVQQQAYNQITPQIISSAEQAKQNEINNMMQLAGMYNTQDTTAYNRSYQAEQDQYTRAYQAKNDAIAAEEKKINQAWNRVQSVGYVDNVAAAVLGIPVGTLSYEAQSAKDQRLQQLQIERENNKAEMARTYANNAAAMARAQVGNQENSLTIRMKALALAQKDIDWTGLGVTEQQGRISKYISYLKGNPVAENAVTEVVTDQDPVVTILDQAKTAGRINDTTYQDLLNTVNSARSNGYSDEEMKASLREEYGL